MSKFTTALNKISSQIREFGRAARRDIDGIRQEIAIAQDDLRQIELASADVAEIERRASYIVACAASSARSRTGFTVFSKPGAFDENKAAIFAENVPAFDWLALVEPEKLQACIVREALAATQDYSKRGPMTAQEREVETLAVQQRIRALEAREELAVRALAEAGLVVERRRDADQTIASEDAAALEAVAQ